MRQLEPCVPSNGIDQRRPTAATTPQHTAGCRLVTVSDEKCRAARGQLPPYRGPCRRYG